MCFRCRNMKNPINGFRKFDGIRNQVLGIKGFDEKDIFILVLKNI